MKTSAFEQAISFILPWETEFVRGHFGDDSKEEYVRTENVAGDSGGVTRYGIDAAAHNGVDVANLTRAQAIAIYRKEWDAHRMDALPDRLAVAAFDVFVNGGRAIQWMQRAYNATHPDKEPLLEDGRLGFKSITALENSDQDSIIAEFIKQRDARFKALAENPARAKFLAGWLARDADLAKFLAS